MTKQKRNVKPKPPTSRRAARTSKIAKLETMLRRPEGATIAQLTEALDWQAHIWIDFHWAGPDSRIAIVDDGNGMDDATLFEAMRPGSANPLDSRKADDLGRFRIRKHTMSAPRVTVEG